MVLITKNYNHYEMVLNFTNFDNYHYVTLASPLVFNVYQGYGSGLYDTGNNAVAVSG